MTQYEKLCHYEKLMTVIREVYTQHADDLCWMDVDMIFTVAGLPVPDRSVGCKTAMKANCDRFIDAMCSGGKWKSYAELEQENEALRNQIERLQGNFNHLQEGKYY